MDPSVPYSPGGILNGFTVATFAGSGSDSIQAMATDSQGYLYVAGTTSSPDFPVRNAAQPQIGNALVLRSSDGGLTWAKTSRPSDSITAIAADPKSAQTVFTGGPNGIQKSTDGGQTWRTVFTITPSENAFTPRIPSIVIDPGNPLHVAAVVWNQGVIWSRDGAQSWAASTFQCPYSCSDISPRLRFDPLGSGQLMLVIGRALFLSRDLGNSFTASGPTGSAGQVGTAIFDASRPGWMYLATNTDGDIYNVKGTILVSTDYGASWAERGLLQGYPLAPISDLVSDPVIPDTLYALGSGGLLRSSDGGKAWTSSSIPQKPLSLHSGYSNVRYLAELVPACGPGFITFVQSGGLLQSTDAGVTWRNSPFSNIQGAAIGAGCTLYAARGSDSSDAFVAKLAPGGHDIVWSTFLGGLDYDSASALRLDSSGNIYVAGTTDSSDFSSPSSRTGEAGVTNVFVAKFSNSGSLLYSSVIGGEGTDTVSGLSVDAEGNSYITGSTSSRRFPATPGVFNENFTGTVYRGVVSINGYLAKFGNRGTLSYSTSIGELYGVVSPVVAAIANGETVVAAKGVVLGTSVPFGQGNDYILRVNSTGTQILESRYLGGTNSSSMGGPAAITTDTKGNVYLAGVTGALDFPSTPGAYRTAMRPQNCSTGVSSSVYAMKLSSISLETTYAALLSSACDANVGGVQADAQGNLWLSMAAGPFFPLREPLIGAPVAVYNGATAVIAQLNTEGSALQYSTYVDANGVRAFAPDLNTGVYFEAKGSTSHVAVLRISLGPSSPVSIHQITNAFSGTDLPFTYFDPSLTTSTAITSRSQTGIIPGELISISGSNLGPSWIDFGLNSSQALPTEAGGTQILFDGHPVPILQTSPDRVIVVAPADLPSGLNAFTTVQASYNGVLSNAVIMPVQGALPGLLTNDFPNVVPHADVPDGTVYNENGTRNTAQNPAAPGSHVLLFATGFGTSGPQSPAGSIATSGSVTVNNVYANWGAQTVVAADWVATLPGFVAALFAVHLPVPPLPQIGPGQPGSVTRVPVAVSLLNSSTYQGSNRVAVYVK